MATTPLKLISIVCPVFNEEATVPLFYGRLAPVLAQFEGRYQFEIIFTNNASTDRTLDVVLGLRRQDARVKIVTLSRNFGYQASLMSGLSVARGSAISIIDVDCEDPPEMLGVFIDKLEEGYDLVYGVREGRPEPAAVTFARKAFYRVLKAVADFEVYLDMAEFSLMSARMRDQVVANRNTFPFIRSELAYAGFRKFGVRYNRQPRIGGQTHYNLFSMAVFGVAGILTSSTFAFRFAGYALPPLLLINLLSAATLLFVNGAKLFQLLMILDLSYIASLLALHGLYTARIYKNGISRPIFIIDTDRTYLEGEDGRDPAAGIK